MCGDRVASGTKLLQIPTYTEMIPRRTQPDRADPGIQTGQCESLEQLVTQMTVDGIAGLWTIDQQIQHRIVPLYRQCPRSRDVGGGSTARQPGPMLCAALEEPVANRLQLQGALDR